MTALRIGTKVYIGHHNGFEQLFDLRNDPAEDRNLVDAPDERAALTQFRAAMPSIGGVARNDSAAATVRK